MRALARSSGVLRTYCFVLPIFKRFSVRVRFIFCSWDLCKLRERLSPDVSVLAEPIVNAPSRISSMNPCLRLSQTSVPVDWLFRRYSCQRRLRAFLAAFSHLTVGIKRNPLSYHGGLLFFNLLCIIHCAQNFRNSPRLTLLEAGIVVKRNSTGVQMKQYWRLIWFSQPRKSVLQCCVRI